MLSLLNRMGLLPLLIAGWKRLLYPFVYAIDFLLDWVDPPSAKNMYLETVFGPVSKENYEPIPLPILKGYIPESLNGTYLRNGPNPLFKPKGWYHWFDGEAMIHMVQIKNGSATYRNQMLNTPRLQENINNGRDYYVTVGSTYSRFFIFRILWTKILATIGYIRKIPKGSEGTANTSLLYHSGNLFALQEASLPFRFRLAVNGLLKNMGYYDFGRQLKHSMTAHPKKDPNTGELLFYSYDVFQKPHATLYIASANSGFETSTTLGEKSFSKLRCLPLMTQKRPVMMHDMAFTRNYIIIFDLNLVFKMENAVKSLIQYAPTFVFDSTTQSRFGIVRRDFISRNEQGEEMIQITEEKKFVKWFDALPCFMFHSLNAWEQVNKQGEVEVVLIGCRVDKFDLQNLIDYSPVIYRWIFNMTTGGVTEEPLLCYSNVSSQLNVVRAEFPIHHPSKGGSSCRYGYFLALEEGEYSDEKCHGVVKVDFEAKPHPTAKYIYYNKGEYGGECSFIPFSNGTGNEDDGYLVSYTCHFRSEESKMWIINAKTMEVVTVIGIPYKIPLGFHGMWLGHQEFEQQLQ